jgi:site-specific DNA recombinase
VREIFRRFIQGETPYTLSVDLNRREIPTTRGKAWTEATVRRLLRSRPVAGICVHRGEEIGIGKWPAIIARPEWDFAQELLSFRSTAAQKQRDSRPRRTYILRGLVICGNCGTTMTGCSGTLYRCSRANRQDGQKCARSMLAEPLEQFVEDAAVKLLAELAITPARPRTAAAQAAEREIAEDEQQLKDLHDMWLNKEIDSAEYRKDRRIITARIRDNERKTITKAKPAGTIADLIGPDPQARWDTLTPERKNTVLRFLFSAVVIGPGTLARYPASMDFGRVEIEQNELT